MDARRSRRTKDAIRKAWYAYYRQVRFARWLGGARSRATRLEVTEPAPSLVDSTEALSRRDHRS